jgi:5-methylcytosine-specific restriction enzyme subunit McrC
MKRLYPHEGEIAYHPTTHGNELDFLLKSGDLKLVLDAKYKPLYMYGKNHTDMRQLSGYARLDFVHEKLGLPTDANSLIDALVIYPDIETGHTSEDGGPIDQIMQAIKGYKRMFKLGIKLPVQEDNSEYV